MVLLIQGISLMGLRMGKVFTNGLMVQLMMDPFKMENNMEEVRLLILRERQKNINLIKEKESKRRWRKSLIRKKLIRIKK